MTAAILLVITGVLAVSDLGVLEPGDRGSRRHARTGLAVQLRGPRDRGRATSRWQLRTILAASRRGFERVTLQLTRRGKASRAARITIEWMSPGDARSTFGLPRLDGQRGILLTFGRQVTTTGTQLIGPLDLGRGGLGSISGVCRFVDFDGAVRAYIALRDEACARIRAPGLEDADASSRRATILVDLGPP